MASSAMCIGWRSAASRTEVPIRTRCSCRGDGGDEGQRLRQVAVLEEVVLREPHRTGAEAVGLRAQLERPGVVARPTAAAMRAGCAGRGRRRRARSRYRPRRRGPREEATRDHEALDLVGAFADDHERGVAEVALDGQLGRVADAAVDAHRLGRDLERGLAREQLGHAGLDVAALARPACAPPRCGVSRRAASSLVAMSASLSWMAWCSAIGLPNVTRSCAYASAASNAAAGHADGTRRDVDAPDLERAEDVAGGRARPRRPGRRRGRGGRRRPSRPSRCPCSRACGMLRLTVMPPNAGARLLLDDEARDALVGAGRERDEAGAARRW